MINLLVSSSGGDFSTSLALQDGADAPLEGAQLYPADHAHSNDFVCWYIPSSNTFS